MMNRIFDFLLACTLTCSCLGSFVVTSPAGTFVGFVETVESVEEADPLMVTKFLGIPYAEAPTGHLRFKKPVPKKPLASLYDASYYRPACFQGVEDEWLGKTSYQSEDCLFLNIVVPQTKLRREGDERYAVMIWIYGGGFTFGFADPYNGGTLSAVGEVIVVTFNYRLSVWGFGSTGDKRLPGNYGLWDQHLAIQWVHDNIAAFGGDPSRVTLFGESAGAASVTYQALYPGNKGLIHRGIAQSGSLLNCWAFNKRPGQTIDWLAKHLDCVEDMDDRLADCLRNKSVADIQKALEKMRNDGVLRFETQFGPVEDEDFLNGLPLEIINMNNTGLKLFRSLDFIFGITKSEGLMMFSKLTGISDPETFEVTREVFDKKLIKDIIAIHIRSDVPEVMVDIISAQYTDWSDPNNSTCLRQKYVQMLADIYGIYPLVVTSSFHAKENKNPNTFLFHFDIVPSTNVFPIPSWAQGANHASEIPYVFGFNKDMLNRFRAFSDSQNQILPWEKELSKTMMTLWTNFAKTGKPTSPAPVDVTWPPQTARHGPYVNIMGEGQPSEVREHLYARNVHFWSNLIPSVTSALQSEKETSWLRRRDEDDCSP